MLNEKERKRVDQLWTIPKKNWSISDFELWNRSVSEYSGINPDGGIEQVGKDMRKIYLEKEAKRMKKG